MRSNQAPRLATAAYAQTHSLFPTSLGTPVFKSVCTPKIVPLRWPPPGVVYISGKNCAIDWPTPRPAPRSIFLGFDSEEKECNDVHESSRY
jgi:hypothetical protein